MQDHISALAPLSYPIRFFVVFKYLGFILLISTAFILVPFIASLCWQEYGSTLRYGIICIVLLFLGLLSLAIPRPKTIQSNEVYTVIALAFAVGSFAMAYPLMGSGLNFIDAWFESVSGLTTTGLTLANLETIDPKTFFFARSWMQWYGGLGIVIFGIGLAYLPVTISKSFLKKVAYKDDKIENSKVFARKILLIYSMITILGFGLLWLTGINWIDAVELTFSSISTGGFSPYPDNLESVSRTIQSLVCVISFLGALSFPHFWLTSLKNVKALLTDIQFLGLIFCILFFTILVFIFNSVNRIDAFFNVIAAQTTAGFSTLSISEFDPGSKFLLLASMLIGGGTLSTAGGIKILRLFVILQAIRHLFFRTSITKSTVVSEKLSPEAISCMCVFSLYIIVIFISTLAFVTMGYPLLDSLFDVVSAIGTVGLSSGLTSSSLPALLKVVLGMDMLLGRLEIVTLLVIFYPRTLIGRRNKA